MDDKLKSIFNKLKSDFPDKTVKYQFANELHKFRIEEEGATYWLYIYRDYFDDTNETDLITAINTCKIIQTFKNSKKSKWLYLDYKGVHEVDEQFAK